MIRFGIRQSFDRIDQIEERFRGLDVPVELALPYHWGIFKPVIPYLKDIAEKIKSYHIEVLSVHSVQSPISNDEFKIWGREIGNFTKAIGGKIITFHPNNANQKHVAQQKALENLKELMEDYNDLIFSIETFSGKRRVFTPQEIVGFKLPMTLDTAHISDNNEVLGLLKEYKNNIVNVHLSAKNETSHHLPIDDFCKEVVDYLERTNWKGNIILEYLPKFHSKLLPDLKFLKNRTRLSA
jgi:sugar phosphate isomerase/epimerase